MRTVLREPRRLLSSALAIVLGVAFTCATLILGSSLSRSYADQVAGRVKDASVVVNAAAITPETVAQINALPGVTGTRPLVESGRSAGSPAYYVQILTLPQGGSTTVLQGRLPTGDSEIVINEAMAQAGHLKVGDRAPWPDSTDTIVGIVKPGSDASAYPSQPAVLAPDKTALRLADNTYAFVMVSGPDGAALAATIKALPALSGDKATVAEAAAWTAKKIEAFTGNTAITTGILLTFGVIAFFVAALVISNTFSILVAQNTRRLALLRCLGASRAQTFRQVLGEAVITAAIAGVVGLGAGWGLVSLLPRFAPDLFDLNSVTPDAVALITPWLAGIAVTVGAAALPALAATRVPPLAALRPDLTSSNGRPIGWVRTVAGLALFVLGVGALVTAALQHDLVIGLAGGVLNFAGVLLLGPWWIPAAAAALGRPFRAHIVGQLAGENTRRTPRRAATTAGALLIGTTLVSMVLTGAAIASATIEDTIVRRYPAEIMVYGPVTPQIAQRVGAVNGVQATAQTQIASVEVEANGRKSESTVLGLTDATAATFGWSSAQNLAPDEITLGSSTISHGSPVTVSAGGASLRMRARIVPQASLSAVRPEVIATLAPDAEQVLLVKLTSQADPATVLGDIGAALGDNPELSLMSSHTERDSIAQAFSTVLIVVLGLLAVSVLISLVGVGNTLGLSVLERRRETALLRALGLDASAVRRLLGGEALLLGGVAGVAGVLLGIGYGIAGIQALLGEQTPVLISVPVAQLLLLVGLSLGLAWVASVLPAGRAASVSPAAALAQE